MVFDLVRPLGAKRGEAEINMLGIVPFRRTTRVFSEGAGSLGVVPRSRTLPDLAHGRAVP